MHAFLSLSDLFVVTSLYYFLKLCFKRTYCKFPLFRAPPSAGFSRALATKDRQALATGYRFGV